MAADRWEEYHFTIAAGATETESFILGGGDGIVSFIRVVIPNGHANKTLLRIFYETTQVVPRTSGTFIRGNNRQMWFDTKNYPTGQGWKVVGTNNGTLSHTFHIYFGVEEFPPPEAIEPPPPVLIVPIQ